MRVVLIPLQIEVLQDHGNVEVYEKARQLLENYFGAEDDDNEDAMMPPPGPRGGFNF